MKKTNENHAIDVEQFTREGKNPPAKGVFKIRVNNDHFLFDDPIVTGKEIQIAAGLKPVECHTLYEKFKDCDFEKVSLDEKVNLAKPGIEHFISKGPEVWHYTVDDEPETSDNQVMTAAQILQAADLKPADYYLVEIMSDQSQKSYRDTPNEPIRLRCPGSKFISVFNGETPVS